LSKKDIVQKGVAVMIKIAICDDEDKVVSLIEKMLLDVSKTNHIPIDIDAFYCGEDLEKAMQNESQYDLLYLDIHMKGESGILAAQNIRKMDQNLLIIYVSSYDRYLIELFRLDVFDFIKKPIQQEVFAKTFLAANERICSRKVYFPFQYKNKEHKILCSDIVYFESKGRQVQIHIKPGGIEVFNDKLNAVEERMYSGKIPFLRIHQSFLVNYHYITARTKTSVIIVNGQELPISEERQKSFGQIYGRLLKDEISV
jgi:DNA-binding LytR/AlgR family response regulator